MFKLCDFSHLSQTENLSKRFIGVQAYTVVLSYNVYIRSIFRMDNK